MSRQYCYTLNNYSDQELQKAKDLFDSNQPKVVYHVFQQEKGESGTPHLQGFIRFDHPTQGTKIKTILSKRIHFEIAVGTPQQNKDYCTKEDTRIEGPYEYGECPILKQGKRNDAAQVLDLVNRGFTFDEIAQEHPAYALRYGRGIKELISGYMRRKSYEFRPPNVHIRWGPTGSGKSRYAADRHGAANVYVFGSYKNEWWDDYTGQEYLVLDDFYGQIPYSRLLRITDGHSLMLNVKGSHTYALWKKVYITSNQHPSKWYPHMKDTSALNRRIKSVKKILVDTNQNNALQKNWLAPYANDSEDCCSDCEESCL